MLGFLLSLLIPIKIAAAAVLIYLFLKLSVAAETPNSKLLTLNIKVDEVQSWDVPQGPGVKFEWRWIMSNVIHKIIELAIYIGFGFEYNGDRIRMVLHITSFRGDLRILPR